MSSDTQYVPEESLRNDPEYVAFLEQRIAALEARLPQTNLVSPKFWTRAWAVYGHMVAVSAILCGVVFIVSFVVSFSTGAATGLFGLFGAK